MSDQQPSTPHDAMLGDELIVDAQATGPSSQIIDLRSREPMIVPEGRRASRRNLLTSALMLSDALCLMVALVIATAVEGGPSLTSAPLVSLAAPALWIVVLYSFELHSLNRLSASEEFRRIISATSFGTLLVVLTLLWARTSVPRLWLVVLWLSALVLELAVRRVWRFELWRLRTSSKLVQRTIIVGTNSEAVSLERALAHPSSGFVPVGFARVDPSSPVVVNHERVIAALDDIDDLLRAGAIDCLFVASTSVAPSDMLQLLQTARRSDVEVRVTANLPEILTSRLAVQHIGGVLAFSLRPVHLTGPQAFAKRAFDVVLASLALVVLSPVLAIIALLVRATSTGPALFRQNRVTAGGRTFTMLKFRTMTTNAAEIMAQEGVDTSVPFFKGGTANTVTPLGRLLRRLSLDELPQLVNVVKGDMSLAGPRPLPADQVAANAALLGPRHEVRAGLTGWWQIQGRSNLNPEESLRMDLFYIENWSLSLDLFILLKTFGTIVSRRGAY